MRHYTIRLPWVTLRATSDAAPWRVYGAMVVHEILELTPGIDAHANRWAVAYALGINDFELHDALLHDACDQYTIGGESLRDILLADGTGTVDPTGATGASEIRDLVMNDSPLRIPKTTA